MDEMSHDDARGERAGADGRVRLWRQELDVADRAERGWRERAAKVIERYRDEKRTAGRRFNILWANVETLKPAVYSQTPKPDVRRRHHDADPVGREAAEILERALIAALDDQDFDGTVEAARDDLLLTGRGVARVGYDATVFEAADGDAAAADIADQRVAVRYVHWRDFRVSPARRWEDVRWVAFRHLMTRAALRERFGTAAAEVPLNQWLAGDRAAAEGDEPAEPFRRAEVWEIWDKDARARLFVADGCDRLLAEEPDPLGLGGFFPMPEPLYGVRTSDTLVPIPEFTIYQDQADELDQITVRIDRLVSALKVRGFYAGALKQMPDLLAGDENELHPADDWALIERLGGLDKAITLVPIGQIAQVLAGLYRQRDQLKQEIYEITGLSDIIRGATQASETATAQRLKGNFGSLRMTPRQKPMQRFVRDLLRLKAEIIAEHFTPATLAQMTGRPVPPAVAALLRDDAARGFRIDIETDSTVVADADAEKAQAVEFTGAVTRFLETAAQVGAARPALLPLLAELLKFSVRRFKAGRTLEETIDRTVSALLAPPPAAPAPMPAAMPAMPAAAMPGGAMPMLPVPR